MKVFFRNIHLYLGLVAGVVIAITCFTGSALVFEKEAQLFLYPERYRVQAGDQRVSVDQLVREVQKNVPGARITSMKIYGDPTRTVELNYTDDKAGAKQTGKGRELYRREDHAKESKPGRVAGGGDQKEKKEGGPGNGKQAFVNPYTGQVVGLQSQRSPFFATMFSLHRWLLAGEVGKLVVGCSTAIFLFILVTGIVLWWPKNKKIL